MQPSRELRDIGNLERDLMNQMRGEDGGEKKQKKDEEVKCHKSQGQSNVKTLS